MRELCRNRFYLVDMGSDLKRKITALLDQVFPEFETQFDSIFCKSALAVLKQYPTPEKLSRAQLGKLTEILQAASNGRFGEWKARQLKELSKDSFGIPDCEGAYSALLLLYLDQLQSLQEGGCISGAQDRGALLPVWLHTHLYHWDWPNTGRRHSQ